MPRRLLVALTCAVLPILGATACQEIAAPGVSTTPPTATTAPVSATTATGSHTTTAAKSDKHWAMPNLVGANLQDAQNTIQKLTGDPLFLTLSHDATSGHRQQVMDRNWKVCAQNLTPGASFTMGTTIDFATVKNEEHCP